MAYSNWGAFIYNKEKDITDICGDRAYIFKNNKWTLVEKEEDYDENLKRVGSHAVIPLTDSILIECYKTYISLHTPYSKIDITQDILENLSSYHYKNFIINGYYINKDENIIKLIVSKENEEQIYCIICGMSVGNGYEDSPISKCIKKHLSYNQETKCYIWNNFMLIDYAIEKAIRDYEIENIKYSLFHYHIKSFLSNLFRLKFQGLCIDLDDIKEDLKKIKYLR